MRYSRFLSFLLAFFVACAAFPGGMAVASGMKGVNGVNAAMSCHESMTADAGSHEGHGAHMQHGNDPASQDLQPQSDCCISFAGMLFSLAAFSPVLPGAREAIPFQTSLRLDARVSGIYHPPRQHA